MTNRRSPTFNDGGNPERVDNKTVLVEDMPQQVEDAHLTFLGQLEVERILNERGLASDIVDASVRVYTLARNNREHDIQAKMKANRYAFARVGGESHSAAFKGVLGFDDQQSVIVADDVTVLEVSPPSVLAPNTQQLGNVVGGDAAPSTLVAENHNFGVPSVAVQIDATWTADASNFGVVGLDETQKTSARRRTISKFIASALDAPAVPPVQPADLSTTAACPTTEDLGGAAEEPVREVGVRSVAMLPEGDIKRHIATCKIALKEEGFEAYLEEGAILYGYLLRQQLTSESAMKQVRIFCRQRQLGADIPAATKAANGSGPIIPEHHPDMDSKVEALLRNPPPRNLTRLQIGLIIALVGTCATCSVGTALYNYYRSAIDQNADAGSNQEPR